MRPIALPFFRAVILDLDGVVTRTAAIHARAWKLMFDRFLLDYSRSIGRELAPLDPVLDYGKYIDGRPRYEGAAAFLQARGIDLPRGTPGDPPGTATIYGLGNRKNELYLELLDKEGAQVFEDTLEMIRRWRGEGLKIAVISASRNCRRVLSSSGLTSLFDSVVDGVDSERQGIKGKPAPDIFLFAARQLSVDPGQATVIEDAPAGAGAGKTGGFGLVVGVSRAENTVELLYCAGADVVVGSLRDLRFPRAILPRPARCTPAALDAFDRILAESAGSKTPVFLDYDGTLTPIVSRPEDAVLSDTMRRAVQSLADVATVVIISGRGLEDIRSRVALEGLWYAGSHGFEVRGPDGLIMEPGGAASFLADLDEAQHEADRAFKSIKGVIVERKKFSLAIHYRLAAPDAFEGISSMIEELGHRHPRLAIAHGKMVHELRPALNWDKGKAVVWITRKIFGGSERVYPLYIGDDVTDEDAFREVRGWGAGILVGDHGQASRADYRLENTDQVFEFIESLAERLRRQAKG
jgi:alpha,alpha-trehalase